MRILSIGNSFSEDALRWVHDISVAGGHPIETVNLFHGGCSLKQHVLHARENTPAYQRQVNGIPTHDDVTLESVLTDGTYDVVTVQQASGASGLLASYAPFIDELAALVREKQPNARLMIHQTWAYDADSDHPDFLAYNKKREMMQQMVHNSYDIAAMALDALLIPSGDLIQALRESPYFTDEGSSQDDAELPTLTRDGFHLNEYYGRYAVSALWYAVLTHQPVSEIPWTPDLPDNLPAYQRLTPEIWAFIRETADRLARENTDYEAEQIGTVPDVAVMPGVALPDDPVVTDT